LTEVGPVSSVSGNLVRSVLVFLGLLGPLWCALTLPTFWNEFPMEQIAERIVRGETFPLETLQGRLQSFRSGPRLTECSAAAAHDVPVLELAILSQSFGSSEVAVDGQLEATRQAIIAGLSCLPADAYLWFALFQVESLQSGFRTDSLRHLAMSYQVSPNEGWIAIPRNRAAYAIFPALPEALQSKVLDEFCLLVRSELYGEAIGIFIGPAKPYRDTVIKRLETVPIRNRQLFAVSLARMGIDAAIPGTSVVVRRLP
jgi:hypothetical protein